MLAPGILIPPRIALLPVCPTRGVPVPWFVAWLNGEPEFRVADASKRRQAVAQKLCWVCGQALGTRLAFVLGPMCAVNRISAEPPCHRDCAEFSLKACPFLTKPHMVRRDGGLPEGTKCAGEMIARNPGVSLLWLTRDYTLVADLDGGFLFRVGDPFEIQAYAEGRQATKEELRQSIDSGLPILASLAEADGPDAVTALGVQVAAARQLLGV